MDFSFTEDQDALRGLAREFLTERVTIAHVRAMMEDPLGFDRDIYRQFIQLGLVPFPEEYGGSGFGMIELAIILEEMGRIPYPGPYFATVVLAGNAIMQSEDESAMARFLPDISNGDLTMSLAFLEDAIDWGPSAVNLVAQPDGNGYLLNGVKRFVPFGQAVDRIIVATRLPNTSGAEGITLVSVAADAPGVIVQEAIMLDLNAKTANLTFENVSVAADDIIGTPGAAWPALDATLQRAAAGAAAEMLGASRKSLEMSVEYAKVRRQFGQVIGQFQAIKHKLSEMLEQVENAHSAVYYAAWAIDAGAPDAVLASSVAKSTLNESSRKVCGEAVQVHGGIGFTWEYDLHLYFKRAKHLEPMYGDTDFHRERVLEEVLAGRVAGTAQPVAA
jgi:alkylation response protein AidB-like acyl-CoA dehydrogenase